MKKISARAGIFLLFFLTRCRDIANAVLDVLPQFDVPFTTNIEIPFAAVSITTYTRTPEIPMNIDLDAKIKENNPKYGINNLKSVKLNTLTVDYISSQLGNRLDVIKSARIYVKSPNQPEKLIATADNNTNPNTITFTSTDAEMLEYFRTSQNSLIIEVMASRPSADVITMKMSTGFKVRVQL